MSAVSFAPYNVSLLATSPLFSYTPSRDGDVAKTWNASYANRDIWPTQLSSVRGAGAGYRRTQYAAAEIALDFEGTGLYACFTSNGAQYTFTLDGSVVQQHEDRFLAAQNDTGPCTGFGAETLLAAPELNSGSHSMRLRVQASESNEFHFFGGMITLEVTTKGYTVDDVIIDDQDPRWTFTPAPGRVAARGALKQNLGTYHR